MNPSGKKERFVPTPGTINQLIFMPIGIAVFLTLGLFSHATRPQDFTNYLITFQCTACILACYKVGSWGGASYWAEKEQWLKEHPQEQDPEDDDE